jgi:hypothetical protein
MIQICVAMLVLATSVISRAQILFEGYYKVTSGGAHIGYSVNKYEYDTKKKQFVSTYFLRTNELGGNVAESLKAYADDKLNPISYSYTTIVGKSAKAIDATFKKNKMTAVIKDGSGKDKKITKTIPKGAFLSTFLSYLILKSKDGFKPDTKFEYQAIAEEDADIYPGVAVVQKPEDVESIKAFRVINDFKNIKFVSFVTEKGEMLSTKSPSFGLQSELVPQASTATLNLAVPSDTLSTLFGSIPLGQENEVAKRAKERGK